MEIRHLQPEEEWIVAASVLPGPWCNTPSRLSSASLAPSHFLARGNSARSLLEFLRTEERVLPQARHCPPLPCVFR